MASWRDFDADEIDDSGDLGQDELEEGSPVTFELPGKPTWFPLMLGLFAALAGLYFAGMSTSDFVAHLDREVHAVHCSVVPGAEADVGDSGCRTVMLSPYSSFFRVDFWGGIPISLWAFAVFAFLAYRFSHLLLRGKTTKGEAGFLLTSSLLPVLMSGIYANIALNEVGAFCATCSGIYGASIGVFLAALIAILMAESAPRTFRPSGHFQRYAVGIMEGVAFVGVFTFVYVVSVPQVEASNKRIKGVSGCGVLAQPEDRAGIMIDLASNPGAAPSIELLDPLCPACRAFDTRLENSGFGGKLDQKAVLFPLDSTCNWMVNTSLHPGACAVSEAMLCAPDEAKKILKWAFERQDELLVMGKDNEKGLRQLLKKTFPDARRCMGTAVARNKMVKSLRWAVANALPVMTPQLFIRGKRLCDEDTDLGLEYTLTRMLGGPS